MKRENTKSARSMSDAAREARNAYKRKWNQEHPEKQREYQCRYWERKGQGAAKEG